MRLQEVSHGPAAHPLCGLLRQLRLPHVRTLVVYACRQACPSAHGPAGVCRGCAEDWDGEARQEGA